MTGIDAAREILKAIVERSQGDLVGARSEIEGMARLALARLDEPAPPLPVDGGEGEGGSAWDHVTGYDMLVSWLLTNGRAKVDAGEVLERLESLGADVPTYDPAEWKEALRRYDAASSPSGDEAREALGGDTPETYNDAMCLLEWIYAQEIDPLADDRKATQAYWFVRAQERARAIIDARADGASSPLPGEAASAINAANGLPAPRDTEETR
jgi:hypothetical protein